MAPRFWPVYYAVAGPVRLLSLLLHFILIVNIGIGGHGGVREVAAQVSTGKFIVEIDLSLCLWLVMFSVY